MSNPEVLTREVSEATPRKSEQISLVGSTWGRKSELLNVIKDNTPTAKTDWLPPDPFGNIDGQLLALKTDDKRLSSEKATFKNTIETDASFTPEVKISKMMSVADHLGLDQHRWRTDTQPHGPKCNIYLDAVMKGSSLPRPWAETGVQSCEKLDAALSKDSRYEKPWSMDYSNEPLSRQNWQYFNQQPGDIFIWNRPDNGIIHSAVADGTGKLLYAGSHASPTGFAHTKSEYFTGTPERPMNYGPPTSVYRYKALKFD